MHGTFGWSSKIRSHPYNHCSLIIINHNGSFETLFTYFISIPFLKNFSNFEGVKKFWSHLFNCFLHFKIIVSDFTHFVLFWLISMFVFYKNNWLGERYNIVFTFFGFITSKWEMCIILLLFMKTNTLEPKLSIDSVYCNRKCFFSRTDATS